MNKVHSKYRSINYPVLILCFLASYLFLKTEFNNNFQEAIKKNRSEINSDVSKVQVPFIENKGQVDRSVQYYAQISAGSVFITDSGKIFYSLYDKIEEKFINGVVFKETFGDYSGDQITGKGLSTTKVNYFKENNRSSWGKNLPTYNQVKLGHVYDGISVDLRAYGNNVEKIFTVQPGANTRDIRVNISGVDKLEVTDTGELLLESSAGNVSFTKPIAYQEISVGEKEYVDVAYVVEENNYSFDVGDYNSEIPLIIDPLLSSTMLGGWCDEISYGPFIEVDDTGNVYLSGFTCTPSFPTSVGAFQSSYAGGDLDCFIAKFNNDLTQLLASTFIGGSNWETECSITLDKDGNIYAGGYTNSQNFPTTTGAYSESKNGGYDIFISKLSNDLTTLIASTYIGGSSNDGYESNRIDLIVGENGDLYLAGQSRSADFPTTPGAYDTTFNGVGPYEQSGDVVVVKMDSTLSTLIASTYLGGSNDEFRVSITLDQSEHVFVSTSTYSGNISSAPGGYDESFNGFTDVFISKLSNDLTTQLASTYLGHMGGEVPFVVEIGENENLYLCGYTTSLDFPTTTGVYDEIYNGGTEDVFISKFDNNLTTLLSSTFFGGNDAERGQALVMKSGNLYITGKTLSADFPIVPGTYDDDYNGGTEHGDIFVSRMDSNLATLYASTFLGGSGDEKPFGIAVDTSGNVFIGGFTHSSDYPTTEGAYDRTFGGIRDVTVAKLLLEPTTVVDEYVEIPKEFDLIQNYPNPFNPVTIIKFYLPTQSFVSLNVYDVLGNEVTTLIETEKRAGSYEIEFDATGLTSGIYFYRLKAEQYFEIKKMVLLK
jgi:hypothetical protein